jgi:hypothetical protein
MATAPAGVGLDGTLGFPANQCFGQRVAKRRHGKWLCRNVFSKNSGDSVAFSRRFSGESAASGSRIFRNIVVYS